MRLHENTDLFRDAVAITAGFKGIPEIYVEKDYWVTLALQRIYQGELSEYTIFKGGTALSKCFSYIERFSEDIDLVLIKEPGLSPSKLKERLKRISSAVSEFLPEVDYPGITNKKGMIRKTAHSYPKYFEGEMGQVRDFIILESSWLGASEPVTRGQVSCYIYEMMVDRGQIILANEYQLEPFDVPLLAPERTLCEKIMSLVRFSHMENPVTDLRNKIRHVYDLHQMLQQEDLSAYFDSPDFDVMLHKVARDDEDSFRNNKDWLYIHPSEAFVFSDLERIWPELAEAYSISFRRLVFGVFPKESLAKETLERIGKRLNRVEWKLKSSQD